MIENEIISLIKNADRIAILPHVSADGDAMGSSLALALALKKLNKKPMIYFEEEMPSIYGFYLAGSLSAYMMKSRINTGW